MARKDQPGTPTFRVGDEVVLVRRRGGTINTTVTKVGRKYFWVEHASYHQKFYLNDGREVTQYGAPDYVTTPEIEAESRRRRELLDELHTLGIRLDAHLERHLPSQSLTRLLAVAAEEAKP